MAVHDLPDNNRDWMTAATLQSLLKTVDFSRHRMFISVNAGTEKTWTAIWEFVDTLKDAVTVVDNGQNLGTARAINKGWKTRNPGEMCVKMDNDVVIENTGWADQMEEALRYDPRIGIVGLKRKDCWEWPGHEHEFYRSTLEMLPHTPGHPWIIVERVRHVMGTCQGYNPALLDKIGYMYQPGPYGWDDVLAAARSEAVGFYNCFLPHIRIDHIDQGGTKYQDWKHDVSGKDRGDLDGTISGYMSGRISPYYDADGRNVPIEELQKEAV